MSRREAPGNFPPSLEHSPKGKFLGCFPFASSYPRSPAEPQSQQLCKRSPARRARITERLVRGPRVINYPSAGLALTGRLSRQGSHRAAGRAAAERGAGAAPGGRRGRAECECTAAGGGRVASRAGCTARGRPGERGESAATERAGTEAACKQERSLPPARPPFGLTRPAGKPAQPCSGLSPAALCTRSQTRCCEGPAFYDCSAARPTSRDGRHFDQVLHSVRKIHWLSSGFSPF